MSFLSRKSLFVFFALTLIAANSTLNIGCQAPSGAGGGSGGSGGSANSQLGNDPPIGADARLPLTINLLEVVDPVGFNIVGAPGDAGRVGDNVGGSVAAAGDFNGDGYDDILVSAPYYDSNVSLFNEGLSRVLFGGTTALLNSLDRLLLSSIPLSRGNRLIGDRVANSGVSVAGVGDVDGDGYDDILVGTLFGKFGGYGSAYLIFGGPTSVDLSLESLTGTNGLKLYGVPLANDGDLEKVAPAGDFNGDGYDDILIAAPSADINGADSGQVYVFYGGPRNVLSALNGPNGEGFSLPSLNGTRGLKINGAVTREWAGFSISKAGDLNNDGFDDIVIGTKGEASQSAYVIFGGSTATVGAWPGVSGNGFNLNGGNLNGQRGFRIYGPLNQWVGYSVGGGGDFNGDGISDIIIGATGDWDQDMGHAYVIFGRANFSSSLDVMSLNGVNGVAFTGPHLQYSSAFGFSVANLGDVNGDTYADIIIGAPSYSGGSLTYGAAYVIFGRRDWTPYPNLTMDQLNLSWVFTISAVGVSLTSNFGKIISGAGDINKDGFQDILVGTPKHPQFNAGKATVIYGKQF